MADFLLIHGSCHGAWCWSELIPRLAALGHGARAIDLPGHGTDTTPPAAIGPNDYRAAILAALSPRTVLVGHSAGGFAISLAADDPRVARLVFLCAYLPLGGRSLAEMRRMAARQPLAPAIVPDARRESYTIADAAVPALFYHDCSPEQVAFARARLCPEPMAPQTTPIALPGRFEAVPKDYIVCTDDRAVPPEFQAEMAARLPPARRHRLDTSHSPFLAAPDRLARLLDRIVKDP